MSITIKCYSEKGMAVCGITEAQAQEIVAKLGKATTTYHAGFSGWSYSRKREDQIREIVATFAGGPAWPKSDAWKAVPVAKAFKVSPPVDSLDDIPGNWPIRNAEGKLVDLAPVNAG